MNARSKLLLEIKQIEAQLLAERLKITRAELFCKQFATRHPLVATGLLLIPAAIGYKLSRKRWAQRFHFKAIMELLVVNGLKQYLRKFIKL